MSKVLICGAGSIGIYLGVMLHARRHDVILFGNRKLRNVGDQLFVNSEIYAVHPKVFSLSQNERYDFILITTKLYDLRNIIAAIIIVISNTYFSKHPKRFS
jgi:ketopantoate reductase